MILAWLKNRIEKLYETDGEDVAQDVYNSMKEIYDRGKELADAGRAGLAQGINDALREFTGYSSKAGRIARMEMAHVVEALRHLVALEAPSTFEQIAGPSVVPVTTVKVEMDVAKMSGNNADSVTSTSTLQHAAGVDYAKLGGQPEPVPEPVVDTTGTV